jgi:hypothetical protein
MDSGINMELMVTLVWVSMGALWLVSRKIKKTQAAFLPVEEHDAVVYRCDRHDWDKATIIDENNVVHYDLLVCYECGLRQGRQLKLHPGLLKNLRANRKKIQDTRDFKERVIQELYDKHNFPISLAQFEAAIREAVERGMTLSRDMAVDKLKTLSEELKSGRRTQD